MRQQTSIRRHVQKGFSLIEALVALVVMAFGMLALAGMQLSISRSGDLAKQRVEAMRLAQARIERMRSFTGISTGTVTWNGLDAIANETVTTNAAYTVASAMAGLDTDPMRPVNVTVSWVDRVGGNQTVAMATVISQSDPRDVGYLGSPLPANRPLRRPKNRDINIPYPAIDLANGTSAYQVSPNYVVVFSNLNANVVQVCDPGHSGATAEEILALNCPTVTGYIVAGYIGRTGSSIAWPTGINYSAIVRNTAGTQPINCGFGDAVDQTSNATIANFKYYICVVPVNTPFRWGGTVRIGGVPTGTTGSGSNRTGYLVCRYEYTQTTVTGNERNIQPYVDVDRSLDEQNYLVTTNTDTLSSTPGDANCPSSMDLTGVSQRRLHQNCRPTGASACPASS